MLLYIPIAAIQPVFYISYLLIDENGDTVTVVDKKETPVIKNFTLEQNYPNRLTQVQQ